MAERLCEKRRVVFSLQLVLWDQFAKFEEMAANKILSLAGCAVGRAHHNVMCFFCRFFELLHQVHFFTRPSA